MKEVICRIGGSEQGFVFSDRLGNLLLQTQDAVRRSRSAMHRNPNEYRENSDKRIHFTPMFVYILEEVLDMEGFGGVWQSVFLTFSISERKILYAVFREGKNLERVSHHLQESQKMISRTIRAFMETLDKSLRTAA